jgi:hypothetical protein
MKKYLAVAAVAGVVVAFGTVAAFAGKGVPVGPYQTLHREALHYVTATGESVPSTCSHLRWRPPIGTPGNDSPYDTNHRALLGTVCVPDATGSDYVDAYSNASLGLDKPVANMKNLSFDQKIPAVAHAGAPRISVELSNGLVAYLTPHPGGSGDDCAHSISDTWERLDVTGFKSNCTFYDSTGATYSANGVDSAWAVFAAAHPLLNVTATYYVADEPGRYRTDRLAMGTAFMYHYGDNSAFRCLNDEARC